MLLYLRFIDFTHFRGLLCTDIKIESEIVTFLCWDFNHIVYKILADNTSGTISIILCICYMSNYLFALILQDVEMPTTAVLR